MFADQAEQERQVPACDKETPAGYGYDSIVKGNRSHLSSYLSIQNNTIFLECI